MVKLFITRVYFRINCEDGERENVRRDEVF